MLKKALVIGGALVLLVTLFNTPTMWSYVSTALDRGAEVVSDAESLENKLRRAETMIKGLSRPIEQSIRQIAEEEVAIHKLQSQLTTSEERLAKAEKDIKRMHADLARGDSHYVYAGKTYGSNAVRADLERRFKRFEVQKETASKLSQILQAREKGLEAAKDKLTALKGEKRQLEVDLARLHADLKMLEVQQASSNLSDVDDSQLSATRNLMEDISTRLKVTNQMLDSKEEYNAIELDEPETQDILDEVTRYFGETEPEANEIALD